jgi:hypothetical protein
VLSKPAAAAKKVAKTGVSAAKGTTALAKTGLSKAKTAAKGGTKDKADATETAKSGADTAKNEEPPSETTALQPSANLAGAIASYKQHPDPASFQAIWKELHTLISTAPASRAAAAVVLKANPGLIDLGAKVDDAAGARVWSFPKTAEAEAVLVQWQQAVGAPTRTVVGRGRHKTVVITPAPTVTRIQLIPLPATIAFRDAQIVRSGGIAPSKGKPGHAESRSLILAGNERGGGTIWVMAYRPSADGWTESPSTLAGIPPYLLQNVAGHASFSGNDLVLSLSDNDKAAGYKIVLRYVDGKFVVEGKSEEGPAVAVMQFMQALQQGKIDLARAWLADPKLITIPRYAGLLNRPAERPFKLIPMSAPLLSGSRFRLMTFDKDDLIVDVGKVKQQWAIKAIFIAPPDPLAQKLVGTLPAVKPAGEKTETPAK